jgi:hypothetical protein
MDLFELSAKHGAVLDDDPSFQRRMVTIDGQHLRAQDVRAILDKEDNMKKDPRYMKFICEVPNLKVDEMYTYNQIEKDKDDIENDTEQLYKFRRIDIMPYLITESGQCLQQISWGYHWIDGKKNPADVVSKHYGHQQVWHILKPLLLFSGDTESILDDGEEDIKEVNNIN